MDRLTEYARAAVEEYRELLHPEAPRVERNWAAIERRAVAELDPGPQQEPSASALGRWGARRIAATAGAMVTGAACIALVMTWQPWSGVSSNHDDVTREAAAYDLHAPPESASRTTRDACDRVSNTPGSCPSSAPPAVVPESEPAPAPAPDVAPAKPAAKRERGRPPKTTATLQELRLIRAARTALRDEDPAAALRALDEHTRRYTGGEFSEEATVLRIAALCRVGRISVGRKLQQKFLATHARSPFAGQATHACPSTSSE